MCGGAITSNCNHRDYHGGMKRLTLIAAFPLVFLGGMICQRFYGLGNLVALSSVAPEQIVDLSERRVAVFLIAGQSNAEGGGYPAEYTPPPGNLLSRVYQFTDDYELGPAREPLAKSGVGPGVAFAVNHLKLAGDEELCVVLVPAARGGTNLHQWRPSVLDDSLYAQAIKRTLAASHYGEITGVLFFQGENDSEGKPTDHWDDWDVEFTAWVAAVRESLGDDALPIVFAQIGKNTKNNPKWDQVKLCQARVDLPAVAMITTDDLPYGHGVHYTTDAYVEIGRRFAEALPTQD